MILTPEQHQKKLENIYYIRNNFDEFQRVLGLSRRMIIPRITKNIATNRYAECEYFEEDGIWHVNFSAQWINWLWWWSERLTDELITHELLHVHTALIRTISERSSCAYHTGRHIYSNEEQVVTTLAKSVAKLVKNTLELEGKIKRRPNK